jgi:hypothetical protein
MPRTPKQAPEPPAEQPQEPKKPIPPATPPLQPVQIIRKGTTAATPPKPPEKPAVEEVKPAAVPVEAAAPLRPKPAIRKPIPKAEIPVIERATGANGDVFNVGDQVSITEPFGTRIPALIDSFYADVNGEIWVRVKPAAENPSCRWEQGCLRSEGLVKVS